MKQYEFEEKLKNEFGLIEYGVISFNEVTNNFYLIVWFDMFDEFVENRNIKLIESLEQIASFDENTFCSNLKPNDFPKIKLNVYRKDKKIEVECEENLKDDIELALYQILKIFFERIFKNFGLN